MQAKWLDVISQFTKQNSPTILSAVAAGGVVATAVLAARAQARVQEETRKLDMSPRDVLREHWKVYIPPVLTGAATITCIIGANQIGLRRNAAIAAAYSLVDKTFREYKEKVTEIIGEEKEKKVLDEVAKSRLELDPPKEDRTVIIGSGEQRCYDMFSGRYFSNDIESIRRAVNDFNQDILSGASGMMGLPLNEFWGLIGLDNCLAGDLLGFNVDHPLELHYSSHLAKDGIPCLSISFVKMPVKDFGDAF